MFPSPEGFLVSFSVPTVLLNYCKVGSTSQDVREEAHSIQEDFLIKKYCYKVLSVGQEVRNTVCNNTFP
jgi:hypothetical protein